MDLEKLLAFHKLIMGKPEEEKKNLANNFGIDYEKYNSRMKGKEKEAEFIVILKSLEALNHFEAYDESLSHITNEYTPDFNIELIDGYKFMLEVKHTEKDIFKISQGNLQRRIDFATRHEIPLRFAISINGMWGLFTSETLQSNNGKLSLKDFLGPTSQSWLDTELATCSYMFPKQIKIRSVYAKSHLKGMGINFPPYGELISYELYCGDKRVLRVKGKNSNFIIYTKYLEALQDRVANSNQEIEQTGEYTIITEFSNPDTPHSIPEYKFLLAPIEHTYQEDNESIIHYNAELAISKKDYCYLSVSGLRAVLSDLVDLGLEVIVFKDSNGYPFKTFADSFWTKRANDQND